ncbi:MAG: hypothetical protein DCC75_02990 [Proteobacteria bacterium]|nr:MAG: hypothetical protein DCC75_02990 [Pseudomonadota bacterium]
MLACFCFSGCVQEKPEGPAEKIGKGVDQIFEGIDDFETTRSDSSDRDNDTSSRSGLSLREQWDQEDQEREQREQERRRREGGYYRSDQEREDQDSFAR